MSNKATCIEWDLDDDDLTPEDIDNLDLPDEIGIPDEILAAAEDDEDAIGDYLSDVTGFCHKGYVLEDD